MDAVPEFSDEMMMAYADDEVDATTGEAIARAAATDTALAARIARHRALRADVFAAFAPVLDEPVPAACAAMLSAQPEAPPSRSRVASVTRLADRRKAVAAVNATAARSAATTATGRAGSTSWMAWGGVAASLVIGVVAGLALHGGDNPSRVAQQVRPAASGADITTVAGRMRAGGALAAALSTQLASAQPAAADAHTPVRIGTSFVAGSGTFCRTFTLQESATSASLAGLACREGDVWQLPVLSEAARETGTYRAAASGLPPAIAAAVDARIQGASLDADAERNAMQKGWKR